jgi:hypothetical protein
MDLLLNLAVEDINVITTLDKIKNSDRLNFVSTIKTNGNATYTLEDINGKIILKDINLKIKDFPLEWIASNFNNEVIGSKILIPIIINKVENVSEGRRTRWNF